MNTLPLSLPSREGIIKRSKKKYPLPLWERERVRGI
jgi:hypothetical protein